MEENKKYLDIDPNIQSSFGERKRIRFGLEQQNHIDKIEEILCEFGSNSYAWDKIGKAIGWDPTTAAFHYIDYLRGRKRAKVTIIDEVDTSGSGTLRTMGFGKAIGWVHGGPDHGTPVFKEPSGSLSFNGVVTPNFKIGNGLLNYYRMPQSTIKHYNGLTGAELIAEERQRQKSEEKFSVDHDLQYSDHELVSAAICYLDLERKRAVLPEEAIQELPSRWPWSDEWWKPSSDDRIKELIKAGALIAAEIDRIQNSHPDNK